MGARKLIDENAIQRVRRKIGLVSYGAGRYTVRIDGQLQRLIPGALLTRLKQLVPIEGLKAAFPRQYKKFMAGSTMARCEIAEILKYRYPIVPTIIVLKTGTVVFRKQQRREK